VKDSYLVKVNQTFDFKIDNHVLDEFDCLKITETEFHILHQHHSYKGQITEANFNEKSYTVKVNNNAYKVEISDELDALIVKLGFQIGAVKTINKIKAPMPGLIIETIAAAGNEVKKGDALLILEAMKMENVLTSPRDGVIKAIKVNKGNTVEKNQLLIEFE
jgi:biotin carboxyl carrier protein